MHTFLLRLTGALWLLAAVIATGDTCWGMWSLASEGYGISLFDAASEVGVVLLFAFTAYAGYGVYRARPWAARFLRVASWIALLLCLGSFGMFGFAWDTLLWMTLAVYTLTALVFVKPDEIKA